MLRLFSRWILLTAFLCIGAIGFIRAQPYDDHGLEALLHTPPACAAPCWLGIRPGETSGTAALTMVEPITTAPEPYSQSATPPAPFSWEFYGRLPLAVGDDRQVYIWLEDEVVNHIFVPDIGEFADLYLLMGKPEAVVIYSDATFTAGPVVYVSIYPGQMYLSSIIECQSQVMDLWHSTTNIHFGRRPSYDGALEREYYPGEMPGWLPDRLCLRR